MCFSLSVDVSATSFMEVLRCCKCINVVTVVVVYNIITFLAAIAALYVTMSVCLSFGRMVGPQRVSWNSYALVSV